MEMVDLLLSTPSKRDEELEKRGETEAT